ncbi:predicted protein [Lichtheimia corymbifera JMRC:FSU:9682]|uniref:Uncharacterized protein n=1 Tax=Lichtheimia corymbifera JMRC:FSU:9682 TaxID=1263082 RepID=A0A068SGR6_9FUNG|nr:predicted protein [Lichtheimia corymbifera JMRC:FSU:9682]
MFSISNECTSIKIGYDHNEISVVPHGNTHMMVYIPCQRYVNQVITLTTISTHDQMPAAVYSKKQSPLPIQLPHVRDPFHHHPLLHQHNSIQIRHA